MEPPVLLQPPACKIAPLSPLPPDSNLSATFGTNSESAFTYSDFSPSGSTGSSGKSDPTSQIVLDPLQPFVSSRPIIIGDRVLVGSNKQRGTVAYVGPTHFAKGNLAGVVLDEPKGRHDGTAHGIRYFKCAPKCGIFCRLDTLVRSNCRSNSPNTRIRDDNHGAVPKCSQPVRSRSPSTRKHLERLENWSELLSSQVNGTDCRRISIQNSTGMVRSSSARFIRNRPTILSVVGPVQSPPLSTCSSGWGSNLRGSQKRPTWLPPGSHDSKSAGLRADGRRCASLSRSLTLPRSFTTSYNLTRSINGAISPTSTSSRDTESTRSGRPSFWSLTVLDSRGSRRKYSKSNGCEESALGVQPKLWSSCIERTGLSRSMTAIEKKMRNSPRASRSVCFSPFVDTLGVPDTSMLDSAIPAFCADNVISCAQDRLVELQNQVLEVYQSRTKLARELEEQRIQYKRMVELYEKKKAEKNQDKTPTPMNTQASEMRKQLTSEYERTKNLLFELKKLGLELQKQTGLESSQKLVENYKRSNQALDEMHAANMAVEEPKDDDYHKLDMSEYPEIKLKNISQHISDYAKEKFKLNEEHHRQCVAMLDKLAAYHDDTVKQIEKVKQKQNEMDPSIDRISMLKAVKESQQTVVNAEKETTRRLAVELSVIKADIAHLSGRPVEEAQELLAESHLIRNASDEARYRATCLQEINRNLRNQLSSLKEKMESEDFQQVNLLRTNLRIHQLGQLHYKANALYDEQCNLVESKSQELDKALDQLNYMSHIWAGERQLRLSSNHQLRERLRSLLPDDAYSTVSSGRLSAHRHKPWETGSDSSETASVRSQPSKPEESSMTYTLFGALCMEIRRLQARSTNLVDALDSLSSHKYDAPKLASIKSLVHTSKKMKVHGTVGPSFRSDNGEYKKARNHRQPRSTNGKPNSVKFALDSSTPAVNGNKKPAQQAHVPRTSRSDILKLPIVTNSDIIDLETSPFPSANSHSSNNRLRRRPLSFHLRRSFEPDLTDCIPEADEELESCL
ncbi:unnamed protein product [Calicophoron daubneyi]|uniref:CAP-Gly domain-containing protein n=1 Tax=Calicophoron daubneyi TaxID=300641 RepID=A0AAV2T7Q5_CALDB